MIDRFTVQRIIDTAQIVDVVSDFVSLRRAGANYKGLCPFHDDKTPSFMVSPSKNYCKCFACGKGGNPVGFVMEIEQLSYPEALRYLAKKYSIEIKEREESEEEKREASERESMFVLNNYALEFFQSQMYETVDGRAIGLAYFRSRGFRDDIIRRFGLGYSPSRRDALAHEAVAKGYNRNLLLSTGLCYERDQKKGGELIDRFHGRVIFPIYTMGGRVAGFGGRVLDAATKGVNVKYQNSPESIIYSKRRELYGLYQAKAAIAKKDCCFLVEGYTDVMAMHQMGVENVVASSGTALTEAQISLIHRLTQNIVVLYDGDAAGIKASERGIDMLLAAGMNVRVLLLPDGHDPDSFARDRSQQDYQQYIQEHQVDFIKFKTDLLLGEAQGDPIKMSHLTQNIVQSISVIPQEITRQLYIRQAAAAMGLRETTIQKAVDAARRAAANAPRRPVNTEAETKPQTDVPPPPPPTPQHFTGVNGEEIPLPSPEDAPPPPEVPFEEAPVTPAVKLPIPAIEQQERNLAKALVRYGTLTLGEMEDEESGEATQYTVAQYIQASLEEDELEFDNPLYSRVLTEALKDTNMQMFMSHPEPDIQALAFQLATDNEQLSKMYDRQGKVMRDEERLPDLVSRLVAEYKLSVVNKQLKELMYSLRTPEVMADRNRAHDIMQQMCELKRAQSALAHFCGDRVVNN